jgi:Protein of unknown function (DUF2975)
MTACAMPETSEHLSALQQKVAGLCHLIRWASLAWIGWALAIILQKWTNIEVLKQTWGRYLNLDLTALPASHHAFAFAVVLFDWAIAALLVVFVWRLFGCYLRGSIFTAEAVTEMRNIGYAGVASVAADMIARPLIQVLLSWHLGAGARSFTFWAEPNDVLHILMALFVVALAHIFKAGVEIADDHRQII